MKEKYLTTSPLLQGAWKDLLINFSVINISNQSCVLWMCLGTVSVLDFLSACKKPTKTHSLNSEF